MVDYKHFGINAILFLFLGLVFVVLKWPRGIEWSFSQHVARHKNAVIYYALLFIFTLPLLLLFLFKWFIPHFEISVWFGVLVGLSSACQIACTIIPETGGWKTKWHRVLAGLSAILLLPVVLILAASPAVNDIGTIASLISVCIMSSIVYIVVKNKGNHPKFLLLQTVYFLAFFSPIVVATYL